MLVDRYHEHILKTPTEVKHARHYLPNKLYPPRTFMLRMQQ